MTLLERAERLGPSFAEALGRHGERPALLGEDGSLTYAELDLRVADVAARLGSTPRLVLLEGANRIDAVVAYLACLRAGHPVVLVPPGGEAGVSVAFSPDVQITEATRWEVASLRSASTHRLHPHLALLLSTSGSTGAPRLVRLSHRNLASNAAAIADYLRLG